MERVTIRKVAREAGVSIATVSRVFANSASVSHDLRRRVLDAAEGLGYTPHAVAQSLALGRTAFVGVLVSNLANPYVCGLIKRMLQEAEQENFRLIIADTDEDVAAERSLGLNLLQRTDGLIMISPGAEPDTFAEFADLGKPLVVVNRALRRPWLSTVLVNSARATGGLVDHLVALGHRRIAYLHGPEHSWHDRQRWRAIEDSGPDDLELVQLRCGGGMRDGQNVVPAVLETGATAALAFNDMVAFGILSTLLEEGIRVPEDLSLCGFDDVPFARCVTPSLTTACAMQGEAGLVTWNLLKRLLQGEEPGASIVLEAQPVLRRSTASPH